MMPAEYDQMHNVSKNHTSNLNSYQDAARETAIYPGLGTTSGLVYCALGLCGEIGEVHEKIKKAIRDDGLRMDTGADAEGTNLRDELAAELGDVLWYLANMAMELGYSMQEIADANAVKLHDRKQRDKLHGSGDHR